MYPTIHDLYTFRMQKLYITKVTVKKISSKAILIFYALVKESIRTGVE